MRPLITLATDFGSRDPYAAAIKGVILSQCGEAKIVDLTHEIAVTGVIEGALFLAAAVPWYPHGTIHVVVVDPGVGTDRLPIVARLGGQTVVCPDNGLLTLLAQTHPLERMYAITNPDFMAEKISPTFHGRDVFAFAAGRIAAGANPEEAGPALDSIYTLDLPKAHRDSDGGILGEIIHVDRFGNLITNISDTLLNGITDMRIRSGALKLSALSRIYADVPPQKPLAVIGGSGRLEIAVNLGSAHELLRLTVGDKVEILA